MSKVTFSLVGGQPFPVYAQALDSEPDNLLLFYSEQTERIAQNIEQCIKQKLPKTTVSKVLVDATNLKESSLTFNAYANAWLKPGNVVTVNLSGGTKPWSMQLLNIFAGKDNARCVFIDQNNYIWDMASYERHKFEHTNHSLDDKFALYGVRATHRTSLEQYDSADFDAIKKIEKLYRRNSLALRELTKEIEADDANHIIQKHYFNPNYSGCHINRLGENDYECTFEHYISGSQISVKFSSPHATKLLLNTSWFEIKVAKLLSQWHSASRVWVNTTINYYSTDDPANEIDIIVETKQDKLLFVECKTQIYHNTDIDKFNNAIKSYGGLGSKRVFITMNTMKELPKTKCEALRIPTFTTRDIEKDNLTKQNFFAALDKYMGTINAR